MAEVISVEPGATESETLALMWSVIVWPGRVRPSDTTTSCPWTVTDPSLMDSNDTPAGNVMTACVPFRANALLFLNMKLSSNWPPRLAAPGAVKFTFTSLEMSGFITVTLSSNADGPVAGGEMTIRVTGSKTVSGIGSLRG